METERHRKLTELFSRVLGLGPDERKAILDDACAGDAWLREEVESLLAFHERVDEFPDPSAVGPYVRSLLEQYPEPPARLPHPASIGPYRILGVLGEGGQGIVFKAEQATPRRLVALKVLRAGPFATADDLRRFDREIRALALLRHPAIATIYDGGHTNEGQHYFAMELVDGTPINAYVRERSPSLTERLELFCRVCEGVEYAHRTGVIHRDLKPTNILVDGSGEPKILDFGLVRIADPEISGMPAASVTGSIVGSLQYMSPEQTHGGTAEVKPQSDVYSLGVVLYELLTGKRPYEVGESLPEAVLTIREALPAPPSTIDREVPRDLDTIILTALGKEPSRRYGSVGRLVDDVRRFLDGEPISARPASLAYVLGKKLRRHRFAAGLAAVVLVVGAVWVGFRYASQRRDTWLARSSAVEMQRNLERIPAERVLGRAHGLFRDNPELPEVGLMMMQAQSRAGVADGPAHYARIGIENSRHPWAFRLLLARVYDEARPELARDLEERALQEFPDTAEAWYLRSFTTFDLHEAIDSARVAIEKDPRHLLATSRLAFLCERTGNFACAHEATRHLLESQRSNARRYDWTRFQAALLMKQGRYDEAIDRYNALGSIDRSRSDAHFAERALAHLCAQHYEQAVDDYTAAIEVNARSASWNHRWRATPLWILGRLEEALADHEVFRTMDSTVSYADARLFLLRHDRARQLDGQGRADPAERLRQKARAELTASRRNVELDSWLAQILACLAGELSPEELIRAADRSDLEKLCEAFYYAAEASLLAGRTDDARRWFRDCVATGVPFDVNEFADPMSEYHLARWRERELGDG